MNTFIRKRIASDSYIQIITKRQPEYSDIQNSITLLQNTEYLSVSGQLFRKLINPPIKGGLTVR